MVSFTTGERSSVVRGVGGWGIPEPVCALWRKERLLPLAEIEPGLHGPTCSEVINSSIGKTLSAGSLMNANLLMESVDRNRTVISCMNRSNGTVWQYCTKEC